MKKVGIIAPSGAVENFDENAVKNFFNQYDIEAVIFPSCNEKYRYMAGCDDLRLDDIHAAFKDYTIDTIICARGGYGAIRLLDKINYDLIKKNKKNFIGFSDITALLIAFYKNAGLKTFHGKMAVNGVLKMNCVEFQNYCAQIKTCDFKTGLTGGVLWGGNLTTIVSLFGCNPKTYIPNEDIILFLEDVNEPDYKIDRAMTQILRNKTLAGKIKGVIFGEFQGGGEYLEQIKLEFVQKLKIPYENNLNITHNENNIIVPFGKKV